MKAHFDEMMTSKDAKIMNLIEGTDFQALLVQHEMEVENLKRLHIDELERVRMEVERGQKNKIEGLIGDLASDALVAERLRNEIIELRSSVEAVQNKVQEKNWQILEMERNHNLSLSQLQKRLDTSVGEREKLNQTIQNLRHYMLRLKLKIKV